jgi:hypothetical protein
MPFAVLERHAAEIEHDRRVHDRAAARDWREDAAAGAYDCAAAASFPSSRGVHDASATECA